MHDGPVTQILSAIDRGDAGAAERLLPVVYEELRSLAEQRMAQERVGQTIQATALVHEAYLRLLGPNGTTTNWDGKGHFFAAAAEAMRRILVERARAKDAVKRGGSWRRLDLDLANLSLEDVPAELVELDRALTAFREEEPEKAQLVELRFFGGLTMEQAASVLGISIATAGRHWAYARAWLFDEMRGEV